MFTRNGTTIPGTTPEQAALLEFARATVIGFSITVICAGARYDS
jgi:hypothetical protein